MKKAIVALLCAFAAASGLLGGYYLGWFHGFDTAARTFEDLDYPEIQPQ